MSFCLAPPSVNEYDMSFNTSATDYSWWGGKVRKQMIEPVVMFGMHLVDPLFCCFLLWSNYYGLCQRLEESLCLDLQIGSSVTNNFLWELASCAKNWSWLDSQDQYFNLLTSLWKPWIYSVFFSNLVKIWFDMVPTTKLRIYMQNWEIHIELLNLYLALLNIQWIANTLWINIIKLLIFS